MTAMKPKASKTQQPAYDAYSSYDADDSGGRIGPLSVKVVCAPDPTQDVHRSGIRRGVRVLELGCGAGDLSLRIAKLVGPSGLIVGVDKSAEAIDVAQKRAAVSGQCYWTRFVNADPNTFIPPERYDAIVVRPALLLQRERPTFLGLSIWLRPDGVIIITGEPAGSTANSARQYW